MVYASLSRSAINEIININANITNSIINLFSPNLHIAILDRHTDRQLIIEILELGLPRHGPRAVATPD